MSVDTQLVQLNNQLEEDMGQQGDILAVEDMAGMLLAQCARSQLVLDKQQGDSQQEEDIQQDNLEVVDKTSMLRD